MKKALLGTICLIAWLCASLATLSAQQYTSAEQTAAAEAYLSQGTGDSGNNHSSDSGVGSGGGGPLPEEPSYSWWRRFQIHGTFSQGFIYGSGNNYLTLDTNSGSVKWTEGAINISTALTDNFHVGAQAHSYMMGQIGRGNLQLDWAFADYRLRDWLGFRGGKVKAPMGLFNEIEDTDALYNWALLPQSMYEAEYRSYNVPVVGGAIYGRRRLGRGGSISYQFFGGRRGVDSNDGSPLLTYQLYRINQGAMYGYGYGGNLRWETPIRGLTAVVSAEKTRQRAQHAEWPAAFNPYGIDLVLDIDSVIRREVLSLQYQRGKLELAAEGKYEPHWVSNNGIPVSLDNAPRNAWYVMGAYHVTQKLTMGSYFSRVWGTSFNETFRWVYYDPSKPEFYSNDTVLNARYDFDRHWYLKLEGHYIDGRLGGFFPATNPNGYQRITRLLILRGGFTF